MIETPPLVVDIDGTLTDDSRAVDPRVFPVLSAWPEPVVVATGKAMPYPIALCEFLGIDYTVIAENGGVVFVEATDTLQIEGDKAACLAVAEAYPDLKANQNFLALQEELTSTVVNVVNNKERLAMWVPTKNIPAGVEGFDPENVAPLHQRASAGVLLWTDYLDTYLWQNEVLLTETILDNNYGDLKQMYAGLHLLASAAEDLAGSQELSDAQLTAALSAGAAMMIVGQEDLTNDVMRITDEMRAPRTGGA